MTDAELIDRLEALREKGGPPYGLPQVPAFYLDGAQRLFLCALANAAERLFELARRELGRRGKG